jgi:hypothetical protein
MKELIKLYKNSKKAETVIFTTALLSKQMRSRLKIDANKVILSRRRISRIFFKFRSFVLRHIILMSYYTVSESVIDKRLQIIFQEYDSNLDGKLSK